MNRRSFLRLIGLGGVAVAAAKVLPKGEPPAPETPAAPVAEPKYDFGPYWISDDGSWAAGRWNYTGNDLYWTTNTTSTTNTSTLKVLRVDGNGYWMPGWS